MIVSKEADTSTSLTATLQEKVKAFAINNAEVDAINHAKAELFQVLSELEANLSARSVDTPRHIRSILMNIKSVMPLLSQPAAIVFRASERKSGSSFSLLCQSTSHFVLMKLKDQLWSLWSGAYKK